MALAVGARLGPYIIGDLLGTGGMGEVYRATDTRLHRTVAIKVLPEHVAGSASRRERLAREARAVAGLAHPHIRALYDVGEQDGLQFLVMEYLDGETLAQRLTRGALSFNDVLRYAIEIADALGHAHRQGIVHRDVKPANVMLTRSGAKLLDFGLAKLQTVERTSGAPAETSATETDSLTEDGVTVGTVQYMSPEQLEGRRVDQRTDVFAFGAVIYEMATGHRAFVGTSKASLIAAILGHDPPPISVVLGIGGGTGVPSPLLNRIVSKCLAKKPDERWQTASDLKEALTWMAERASQTEGPTILRPRRQPSSRVVWLAASILLIASALSLALVMVMRGREAAPSNARPMRWLLAAPEGTTFDPASQFLALSPDGTHLAFIASSGGGRNALWVRALDAVVPRKLAEGAARPFWSPDSRFVAFDGEGTLKKVAIATGLVEPLADTFITAGSWSQDGTLLASIPPWERRHGPRRLYKISASGGPPVAATTLDPARGETSHTLPSLLPDGRHFLFSASRDSEYQDVMLYVGSFDSLDRVQLFPDHSRAVYASGYVLFARDQTLLAQPFDPIALRLGGEPAIVAENVELSSVSRVATFSVSQTGVLAYRPVSENELVWFDRSGRLLGSIGAPGLYANPALSPDDQRIAVSRHDPVAGQSDIWVIDSKRHVPSKFSFAETSEGMPLWSPDGRRLVYKSGSYLAMKASSGAGPEERLVDDLSPSDNPLAWSPDGRMIIYSAFDSRSSTAAWMLPLAGERKRIPLLNTGDRQVQAQISPDGRWLAYASSEGGSHDVYVRPFPSGDGKWLISPSGGLEPSWRRDGKELFYLAPDGSLMAVSVRTTTTFEASSPVRLFETKMSTVRNAGFTRNQYVPSADGQRFLITQPTGTPASIVVVVDWPAGLEGRK
jgi:serine/threonine protein kinase/Tol biopolymer transport system component